MPRPVLLDALVDGVVEREERRAVLKRRLAAALEDGLGHTPRLVQRNLDVHGADGVRARVRRQRRGQQRDAANEAQQRIGGDDDQRGKGPGQPGP